MVCQPVAPVNRAVESGIRVATFNSEPTSLRGLIAMLGARSERLLSISRELAEAAHRTGEATEQSARTVMQMTQAASNEAMAVSRVNASVQRIATSIAVASSGWQTTTSCAP